MKQELSNAQQNKPQTSGGADQQVKEQEIPQEIQQQDKQKVISTSETKVEITLETLWEKITADAAELGPRISQAVQTADPKRIDENTIRLHITAESHKDLYEKHKKSIYDVLSRELAITDLVFTYELVKSDLEDKRPLKDSEKYLKLVEENPALKLLKDKFNLDIKK